MFRTIMILRPSLLSVLAAAESIYPYLWRFLDEPSRIQAERVWLLQRRVCGLGMLKIYRRPRLMI
jgi:hypothetical protein